MKNSSRGRRTILGAKRFGSRIRPILQVEPLENRQLLSSGIPGVIKFDFGTPDSPVAPGWIGVPSVKYSQELGHGWSGPGQSFAMDFPRPEATLLTRDFHYATNRTFVVDLPPGTYDVTPSLGIELVPLRKVDVMAEGHYVARNLSTLLGQQAQPTFRTSVTDGQLDVQFLSNTDFVYITNLQIAPVVTSEPTEPLFASAGGSLTALEGSPVTLTASATGGVGELSFAWDLTGDGTFETPGREISHIFPDNGEYTTVLQVTDSLGRIALATAVVSVANVNPIPTIMAPGLAVAGDSVQFYSNVFDPGPLDEIAGFNYLWDFGDGSTSYEQTPSYAFAAAGTYLVTLTVVDKDGGVGQASTNVEISSSALASVGLTPGWATFGQALPEGAAFHGLQVGDLVTQTDVKTTWPDGSIRFAIVSANVPQTGTYPITEASPGEDTFSPAIPDASVGFAVYHDFSPLGTFDVLSGTLGVRLASTGSGQVAADAVLIERIEDDQVVSDWIINDADPGFSRTGKWKESPLPGYDGRVFFAEPGSGGDIATWSIAGLEPGRYRVSATWSTGANRSTSAPYSIADGNTKLATVTVDQTRAASGVRTSELYTAILPLTPSTDSWLSGPLVREWRQTVAPIDADGQPHTLLRVVFDTRAYANGASRVDVTVENTLNVPQGTVVPYHVDIAIDDESVFRRDDVSHYWLTRWRQAFDVNLNESQVTLDVEPFYESNALPRYLPTVEKQVIAPEGPKFEILGPGSLNPAMGAPGGRPEIAPYPGWAANFLVHRDEVQREYVLAHGDLAGSWGIHLSEPEGGQYSGVGDLRFVSLDERPNFWFDRRGDANNRPAGFTSAKGPLQFSVAHQPSVAFIPYLVTGDRYYADEMQHWANYSLTTTWPGSTRSRGALTGSRSDGILWEHQIRGVGWAIRNIADAAAYLPDDSSAKAYFTQKLQNNLEFLDRMADDPAQMTPLGSFAAWERRSPVAGDDGQVYFGLANWEVNYLAWAIDRANSHGFDSGQRHLERLVKFELGFFTSSDFPIDFASLGIARVGIKNSDGSLTYFTNYGQVHDAYLASSSLGSKPLSWNGHYGVDKRLVLLIASKRGMQGATEAFEWVTDKLVNHDLKNRSGWSIALD